MCIRDSTKELANKIANLGHKIVTNDNSFFDTVVIQLSNMNIESLKEKALEHNFNLMYHENGLVGISLDEKTDYNEVEVLANLFDVSNDSQNTYDIFKPNRKSDILTHSIFQSINSETEMLRYINKLEKRDLSLNYSMIPLGSCTMKLNATVEMIPISWPEFNSIHPFAPLSCLLYTSPSPRDSSPSRMPSSA